MRLKEIVLIVIIIIGLGRTDLQAQYMYVEESVGTQTTYSLSNISKISFCSGKLTIFQSDSSSATYALDSVRYLSFSDSTLVSNGPKNTLSHSLKAYPNPVSRELKIDLSNTACPIGTLNILSIEGKLIKTQEISGSNIISVDMSRLPRGIYFCQFISEAEIRSFKIIKQ